MEELEDRLKELKNGVQLQQRKNQELEELRTSLHRELSIYKCVGVARGGLGGGGWWGDPAGHTATDTVGFCSQFLGTWPMREKGDFKCHFP